MLQILIGNAIPVNFTTTPLFRESRNQARLRLDPDHPTPFQNREMEDHLVVMLLAAELLFRAHKWQVGGATSLNPQRDRLLWSSQRIHSSSKPAEVCQKDVQLSIHHCY